MKSNYRRWLLVVSFYLAFVNAHAATFTLTVNVSGSGTVGRNPTNSSYPEGSVVILTATPAANWTFNGWSGDASGSTNPLNVTMTSNKTITAIFIPLSVYTLTLTTNGAGTITVNPPTNSFLSNSTVQLQATPAAGWLFGNWSGDASGSTNPLSLVMNSNKSVAANFVQPPQITAQPQSEIVFPGDTANFSVGVTGSAPLTYFWRFNGAPHSQSAQPILTLTNVQTTQAGNYSVLVSNAYGTAISSNARLDVMGGCVGSNVVSDCTEAGLRTAIARGGIVRLCCNGTITLSNTLVITNSVTLDASGRNVVIDGNNAVRLFSVSSNASFAATNLIFADGFHRGTNGADASGSISNGLPGEPGEPGRGGAIYNVGGIVRLVSCVLSNNQVIGGRAGTAGQYPGQTNYPGPPGRGGAICNEGGTVHLVACVISENRAMGGQGGGGYPFSSPFPFESPPKPDASGGDGEGGALFNSSGSFSMHTCMLASNATVGGPGGKSVFSTSSSGPLGAGRGGAIFVLSGVVTLTNSLLVTNQAYADLTNAFGSRGGAVYLAGGFLGASTSTFIGNTAIGASLPIGPTAFVRPPPAYGGAIYAATGSVQITEASFIGNVAQGGNAFRGSGTGEARGGAVYSAGHLRVSNSIFFTNRALSGSFSGVNTDGLGGALYNNGTAIIEGTAFDSNLAKGGDAGAFGSTFASFPGGHAFGGAVFNEATLAVTNCTIAANQAQAGNASGFTAVSGSAYGGGIHSATGSVELANVTLAANFVTRGSLGDPNNRGLALGGNLSSSNGTVTLRNSLLAYGGTNGNAWGAMVDGGFNISTDGSIALNSGSSFSFTDPKLGPLQNNGGPTATMALLPGSPAIDFGGANGAPLTDQRGFPRPSGSGVDIGAFEVQPSGPMLSAARGASNSFILSFTTEAGRTYEIHSSSNFVSWPLVESIGPVTTNGVVTRTYNTSSQSHQFYRLESPVR